MNKVNNLKNVMTYQHQSLYLTCIPSIWVGLIDDKQHLCECMCTENMSEEK